MGKVTKAGNHLSNSELEKKIKQTVGFWRVQKWLIIYNALNYPRQSEEIAKHLAVSKSLVNKTISEYNRFGSSSIETVGKGGRKNAYIDIKQEQDFINFYITKSQKGHTVTVSEIKGDFERIVGTGVHKTTIYRLLDLFLANVSKEFCNYEIIMLVKGAGWHESNDLAIPSNIHFVIQPPFSPEINPTEHVWDEIREKYLHNKIFASLDEAMNTVSNWIRELSLKTERIKSMTLFPFLNIAL